MRRHICFLLILTAFMFTSGKDVAAFPSPGVVLVTFDTQALTETGEDDKDGKKQRFRDENRGDNEERKGIGARFWGGPYWGYGPRWGHPCQTCRSDCESESEGARCERCRVRCGW